MKIDIHNYEEFMLSFIDGELDDEQTKGLMLFVDQHPDLRRELALLQATKLPVGTTLGFSDKASLYKKEGWNQPKIPVFRRYYRISIAVAAGLLLFVALFIYPWKKPVIPHETAFSGLPAQHRKTTALAATDSLAKETTREHQQRQKETAVARYHPHENKPPSLEAEDRKAVVKNQRPEHTKPVLPAAIPDITLPAAGYNHMALNKNDLPRQLPLVDITHSVAERQIETSKDSVVTDNNNTAMALNRPLENENIVQKVDEWRKKPAAILENIHQKGIKIGKTTFAFNN